MNKLNKLLKKLLEEVDSNVISDIAKKTGADEKLIEEQLKKGIEAEKEHNELWDKIKDSVDGVMSEDDFYESIAIAHISEIPNYYDLLKEMEDSAKSEKDETENEEVEEPIKEAKGKCPASGCVKKVDNKWRIVSNKTGKLWPQKYDTETKAKEALKAYQSNK